MYFLVMLYSKPQLFLCFFMEQLSVSLFHLLMDSAMIGEKENYVYLCRLKLCFLLV